MFVKSAATFATGALLFHTASACPGHDSQSTSTVLSSTQSVVCAPNKNTNVNDALHWATDSSGVNVLDGIPSSCNDSNNQEKMATYVFGKYYEATKGSGGSCDFGGVASLQNVADLTYSECAYPSGSDPAPAPPAPAPSPSGLVDGPCGYADDDCARSAAALGYPLDMDCYGYSGQPWDPAKIEYCSLFGFSDSTFGYADIDKDPSLCEGPVFYLWDEPATHGMSYKDAGSKWVEYANKWSTQLNQLRAKGTQIVGVSVKMDNAKSNMDDFMSTCSGCLSDGSNTKLDGLAYNPFVGSWSHGDYTGSNVWSVGVMKDIHTSYPLDAYVTNYSYLGTDATPDMQKSVMEKASDFFGNGSPVVKVMWFSADHSSDSRYNGFDTQVGGETLGDIWNRVCAAL